jgi:hypothetical protein
MRPCCALGGRGFVAAVACVAIIFKILGVFFGLAQVDYVTLFERVWVQSHV